MDKDISTKQKKIRKLLDERKGILLAHYYQRPEIQDIADFRGDSLGLSIRAAQTNARVIVFAGVRFMAESASILSPDKTVLLPRLEAGCPLADMITGGELRELKRLHPGVPVVTYVNSSAATKANSDVCCTSANSVKVVNSFTGAETVIMVPDGNLARYTARFTDKRVIPGRGYCYVHHNLSPDDIRAVKEQHPKAVLAVHPECTLDVIDMADFVGSTSGILQFAREAEASEIIVGTEHGIMHLLEKENPGKTFIPASPSMICRDMKLITLDDILDALTEMKHVISVPDEIRKPAYRALRKMLDLSS